MKAMLKGVIASLNIEKKKPDAGDTATAEWYKDLEPKLLKIGAVTLAPSTETGKNSSLTFTILPTRSVPIPKASMSRSCRGKA
jgi:hypothetical protein